MALGSVATWYGAWEDIYMAEVDSRKNISPLEKTHFHQLHVLVMGLPLFLHDL